jgi:phosphate starvation-inducible PhoH-like protein
MSEPPKSRRATKYKNAELKITSGLTAKTPKQQDLINALKSSQQVFILGPAGCKSGDTIIHYRRGKRNSNRSLTLKEFVGKFNGEKGYSGRDWQAGLPTYVQSINQDTGEVFYNLVEGAWYTGRKESVRISTDGSGHVDITTDDSVLLENGSFKKASEVVVGDRLLCKGSMACPSLGSKVKSERKKERVVVEGLKYYAGGWNKFVIDGDKTYLYKRNHRSRLMVEANLMSIEYEQYIHDLKHNPNHNHKYILPSDTEVHHLNGDCADDRLENFEILTKAEHARLHSGENVKNFNRDFTKVSTVTSVTSLGEIEVYDLTMEAPWHNYVVNDGIIAHNTGKTYVTATYAADLYTLKKVDKIVITRPMVSVGKELGFLKGDLQEKTMPWALPVLDVLEKHLGKATVEIAIKGGNIEMAPLALMRGRSFENAFIIVDETQNITTHELKMLLTRVGEGTTIVLNGDVQQSDLKEADGLTKVIHLAKKHMLPIPIIEFGVDDIIRSDITAMWVKIFLKEGL